MIELYLSLIWHEARWSAISRIKSSSKGLVTAITQTMPTDQYYNPRVVLVDSAISEVLVTTRRSLDPIRFFANSLSTHLTFLGVKKSISSESSRKKHLISLDVTRISGNGLKLVEETFLLFLFPRFLKVFRFDLDPFFIKNILPETSSLISRCNNLFARCYSGKLWLSHWI